MDSSKLQIFLQLIGYRHCCNFRFLLGLYRISGSNPVSGQLPDIRPVTGYPAGTGYEQKSGRITVPIVFLYELKNNYEKVKTQALFN